MSYAVRLFVLAAFGFASSSLLATSTRAQDPNGYPVANVNLRAGPGTEYPIILTVPAEAPIAILGCVPDYTWCDSVFQGYRGWMRSIYLAGYYEGRYYPLGDYAPQLGYQTVSFNIDAYWGAYYRDRPFYAERRRYAGPREQGWMDDSEFYDRLSPHGQWTWIQGRYVWVPTGVDRGWRPYTRGRWVYTDRGWMWASNEPFGWATYHYGRWGYSDRVGWFWVPGKRWAPAWVAWRQSDDYLAWAPLPPSPDEGISINISIGDVPNYYWQAVAARDFLDDDLPSRVIYERDRYGPILERTRPIGHTTIINNQTTVNNVVNVNYVEQTTNQEVVEKKIVRVKEARETDTVRDDAVEVYEPEPEAAPKQKAPPEPKKLDEVAAVSETKGQVEGAASTEDQLVPPEVKDAVEKRKGRKGKAQEPGSEQAARGEQPLDPSLPKGTEAEGPPPGGELPAAKPPVPAETIATPAPDQDQKGAPGQPGKAGKDGGPRMGEPDMPPPSGDMAAPEDAKPGPKSAAKKKDPDAGKPKGPADKPDLPSADEANKPPAPEDKGPPPAAALPPLPSGEGAPDGPKGPTLKPDAAPPGGPDEANPKQGKAPGAGDDGKQRGNKAGKQKGAAAPADGPPDGRSDGPPPAPPPPPAAEEGPPPAAAMPPPQQGGKKAGGKKAGKQKGAAAPADGGPDGRSDGPPPAPPPSAAEAGPPPTAAMPPPPPSDGPPAGPAGGPPDAPPQAGPPPEGGSGPQGEP